MRFDLKRPCSNCPFRTDLVPYLSAARAREIAEGVAGIRGGNPRMGPGFTFACHKTVRALGSKADNEQMCGGALACLAKAGLLWENQMLRIAAGLRIFDPAGIDVDAPVYQSPEAMIYAHRRSR